jgi:hypothetical protein
LYGLWERVDSATKDKTRIMLTFDRAARNAEAPMMGTVEFDTDDADNEEAAPQLGVLLKPMLGMALTIEVNKEGEVVAFSGMDAINRKVSEKAIASMHWEQMKDEFTNERGKVTWGSDPLLIYPNRNVHVGDTWTATSSMDAPMVGTVVTDYQYKADRIGKEDDRSVVAISVTGVMSRVRDVEKDDGATEQNSADAGAERSEAARVEPKTPEPEVELSGSLSGTALYDVALGRVVEETTEAKVDMRIPLSKMMPNAPESEEPQIVTFDMAIKSTTRVLTEAERMAQKAEARKRAELRRMAEEEDDDEEEDD